MQILWLSLFIGLIQWCGAADTITFSPHKYDNLGVPDPNEYISIYTLSVQTAYITSVECMLSTNHYIESGFEYLDSESSDEIKLPIGNGVERIQSMLSSLQIEQDQEIQSKLDAVLFMTVNFYKKQDMVVLKTDVKLSDLTDIVSAQSVLISQRCRSSYLDYMAEIKDIKDTYLAEVGVMDYKHFSKKDWIAVVNQYNEANAKVMNSTNMYASFRDAFMLGSGIDICQPSVHFDDKILEIYNSDDLSSFFGDIQINPLLLFQNTVTSMYSIYKNALFVIYLNSVCHSSQHAALRLMMWEQLNLVRANFEFMSFRIITYIQEVKANAESKFGKDSEEYNQVMAVLQSTVNRMLITAILSTSTHYQRALEFNSDGNMIQNSYMLFDADELSKLYDKTLWKVPDIRHFDMRVINPKTSPVPTTNLRIPHNMYALTVNKLVFQAFLCHLNYIILKMQKMDSDNPGTSTWLFVQITLKEMEFAILSAKCSVIGNKIYAINAATYVHVMLTQAINAQKEGITLSDSESEPLEYSDDYSGNDVNIDVSTIMDYIVVDIVMLLCVHSKDIVQTFHQVEVFIMLNTKPTASSTAYKPGMISSYEDGNYGTSPQQNTVNLSPVSDDISNDQASATNNNDIGTYGTSSSNDVGQLASASDSNSDGLSGTTDEDITVGTMDMESLNNELTTKNAYNSITSVPQITERLKYFQTSVTNEFLSSMALVQSAPQTEYTQLVLTSLQSIQDQFNINFVYLTLIVSESEKYINKYTVPDSNEYLTAIAVLFKDTMEKTMILGSVVEVSLSRVSDFGLDFTDYLYISQNLEYTLFVHDCYKYFGIDDTPLYEYSNDANLFLTNSMVLFTRMHDAVMTEIQNTKESHYKNFLKWYLELTLIAYKMTCESIKSQITHSQVIISQSSEISKLAFCKEIILHIETVNAIYLAIYINCHQYSTGSQAVSIFHSDYEVVVTQISYST